MVSDLLLTPDRHRPTTAVTAELARALDTWDGPGILIIAGNLFDLTGATSPLAECTAVARGPPGPERGARPDSSTSTSGG